MAMGIVVGETRDYLSGLPDELLHRILSFLPTRDSLRPSVVTSLLARRWPRVWASVPTVDGSKASAIDRFFASGTALAASRRFPSHSSELRLSGCSVLDELKLNAEYPRHEAIQIAAPNLIPTPSNLQITCRDAEVRSEAIGEGRVSRLSQSADVCRRKLQPEHRI